MREVAGVINRRIIYRDDPCLPELMCHVEYIPVMAEKRAVAARCPYCGRPASSSPECATCGAPMVS